MNCTSRRRGSCSLPRTILEAIAFQVADVLVAMQQDARGPLTELRVDGGASGNDMLMQFQADLLGVPVLRPVVRETTALGAALMAGLGAGVFSSMDELAGLWQLERRFEPSMSQAVREEHLARWHQAVARARS